MERTIRDCAKSTGCAAPGAGAKAAEAGFSLVDTLIACGLVIVGSLSAATMGIYASKLQLRVRDYSAAHMAASDLIERLRVADVSTTYAQYSASPVVNMQGEQVTVEFPQTVLDRFFGGSMTTTAARTAGLLPVRVTVTKGGQRFQFATFVGKR